MRDFQLPLGLPPLVAAIIVVAIWVYMAAWHILKKGDSGAWSFIFFTALAVCAVVWLLALAYTQSQW